MIRILCSKMAKEKIFVKLCLHSSYSEMLELILTTFSIVNSAIFRKKNIRETLFTFETFDKNYFILTTTKN